MDVILHETNEMTVCGDGMKAWPSGSASQALVCIQLPQGSY
jgi:hypothetical protein